jgi:hypothetical protein
LKEGILEEVLNTYVDRLNMRMLDFQEDGTARHKYTSKEIIVKSPLTTTDLQAGKKLTKRLKITIEIDGDAKDG